MRVKSKLKDPPFRVVHRYFDGREVVESQHIKYLAAVTKAHEYKRQVPGNTYEVQEQVVIETRSYVEYQWRTVRTI